MAFDHKDAMRERGSLSCLSRLAEEFFLRIEFDSSHLRRREDGPQKMSRVQLDYPRLDLVGWTRRAGEKVTYDACQDRATPSHISI